MGRASKASVLFFATVLGCGCSGEQASNGDEPADPELEESPEEPATTLAEADQAVLDRLTSEGHAALLSPDAEETLVMNACGATSIECEMLPLEIEFVMERGPGMARLSSSDPTKSDWQLIRESLSAVFQDLPETASAGLAFSPPLSPRACGTAAADVERAPLGPDSGQRDLLLAALDETEPTADAPVALVDAYLAAVARLSAGSSGVVVLVTSGETDLDQGCTETTDATAHLTADLTSAVQAAGEAGISTLVVGSPGSETAARGRYATAYLSELANVARGVPCDPLREFDSQHFDMNAPAPVAPLVSQALRSLQACLILELPLTPDGADLPLGSELHLLIHSDAGVLSFDEQPASECDAGFKIENDQAVACPGARELIACLPGARPTLVIGCGESGEVP